MKIGITSVGLGPFSVPEIMAHVARTAEQCGFESLWAPDHSAIPDGHQTKCPYTPNGEIPGGPNAPLVEPIGALSFVAGLTSKIKLGTGVMILPQRHPLYVAKEIATLDLISRGRAILGIGSRWCAEEFGALGLDFASAANVPTKRCRPFACCGAMTPLRLKARISAFSASAVFPSRSKKAACQSWSVAIRARRRGGLHAMATGFTR